MRIAICLALAVSVCACGGKKSTDPTDPNAITKNGCFAVVGNKGNIKASATGVASFSGIVANGGSSYAPGAGQAPATFSLGATDVNIGSDIIITGPAITGTTTASLNNLPGSSVSVQYLARAQDCSGSAGLWRADPTIGSASVTLTSASTSGVTGTFTGTLKPSGGGAAGDKTISGSFTTTF
jgi:hypothetical protein